MQEWESFSKLQPGSRVSVVIKSILPNGDIDLTTPVVERAMREGVSVHVDQVIQ